MADSSAEFELLIVKGLFYLPTLGPGGAERVVIRLLSQFLRYGDDCRLIVVTDASRKLEHLLPGSLNVEYLRARRTLSGWAEMVRSAWRVKPDFIFSTHPHISFLLLISKPFLPRRLALIVRESSIISKNIPSKQPWRWLWTSLYFALYRFADAVVCQSVDMAEDAVRKRYIPKHKISIIGNPVDNESISLKSRAAVSPQSADGKVVLVSAGRFTPDKGFDLLIHAIARLRNDNIHLWLIGEGRDFSDVIELAEKLGVSHQVAFLGYLDNPYPYYLNARFYVMSSRFEGFPNAVLESLALGTPVIAMPCLGGIKELVLEGVNGHYADDVTADALASAIAHAIEEGPFDRQVVANSVLSKFSDGMVAEKYRKLILSTIERRNSRNYV